ncbi:hypothetical protein WJU23_00650 [Prosthecobacter sp. SYSU 5D2]
MAIIIAALFLFMHAMFAWGVFKDSALQFHHYQRRTYFVSGYLWALATLLGGIITVAIYWVIHCSTLRPQSPPPGP